MSESQEEIDFRYYSRWEIAAAREQTADGIAFLAAIFAAGFADLKWDWWVWTICAFIMAYKCCSFGYGKRTEEAWNKYENRPILNNDDPDEY